MFRHSGTKVCGLLVLLASVLANAKTPDQLRSDFADILPAGMKAHAAWAKGGTIYCVDSDSGTIRELTPASIFPGGRRSCENPNVTWDGSRVIFRDGATSHLFVINWDGTGLRSFRDFGSSYQYYARCWTDSATRTDWAVWHNGGIYRTNIDKPAQEVLLWNKTGVTYPGWFSLSADGKRVGMEQENQIVGVGVVPNGRFVKGDSIGCRVSIAADNSYEFMFQTPYHKLLRICDSTGVRKQDFAFNDTIINWSKANGVFVTDLLEHDNVKWTNNRDYIIFYMNCTTVNPFIMRLSDRKFMYLQEGNHTLGPADMAVFPRGAPQDAPPIIASVDNINCQAGRPLHQDIWVRGVPAPTLTSTALAPGVSLVDESTNSALDGTPSDTGRWQVILTATNPLGVDRDTFTFRVGIYNDTPTVNAGPDTSTRIGHPFSMSGTANDDGIPGALATTWQQIDGPDNAWANVANSASLTSTVTFDSTGDYEFLLKANDGAVEVYDQVRIRVLPPLPFVVLKPADGRQVLIGGTDSIVWQIDPPAQVLVELSIDNGLNYTDLPGSAIDAGTTMWVWEVPDTLPQSDSCFVRVTDYNERTRQATSERFRLVTSVSTATRRATPPAASSAFTRMPEFFGIDGRRLNPALLARCGSGASIGGVAICRIRGTSTGSSMVVLMQRPTVGVRTTGDPP